jgi:hypothetical protein
MPSAARGNLANRFQDIEQLLNAHTAIVQISKASRIANATAGSPTAALNALVTNPGRGRPRQVDALNRAAFILSISHFQGYIDELHNEMGLIVLSGRAANPAKTIKLVGNNRANPHVDVINKMFAGIGIYDLMDTISWQNCSNESVRSRLKSYLETRNCIAHGTRSTITKKQVETVKKFLLLLGDNIDDVVKLKAHAITGQAPWT